MAAGAMAMQVEGMMAGGIKESYVMAVRQILLPVVGCPGVSSSSCKRTHYSTGWDPSLAAFRKRDADDFFFKKINVTPISLLVLLFWSTGGVPNFLIEMASFFFDNCTCGNVKSKVQPLKCRSNTDPSF
jgi:hypothetical protein